MKITKIEIFGYGHWIDKTVHLQPQLNVISGRNGSGKSTLMSFVLSVLFGFPNLRRKHQRDYDINPENHFGGRLYLTETKYGDVMIERTRKNGKQLLYMKRDNDKDRVQVNDFSDLLNGLSKADYLNYFGFSEADLMDFVWESEEDFAKSLVSLGVSGRQVLSKITPNLQSEAEKIYKPNGKNPVLNQQLDRLAHNNQQINDAKQDEDQYYEYEHQQAEDIDALDALRHEHEMASSEEIQLELAHGQENSLNEYISLDQELQGFDFAENNSEVIQKWRQVSDRIQRLNDERQELQPKTVTNQVDKQSQANEMSQGTEAGVNWISAHPENLDVMYAQSKAYRNHLNQNADVSEELVKKRYEKDQLLKRLGADNDEELPNELPDDEREKWQKEYRKIQNRQALLENESGPYSEDKQALNDLNDEEKQLRKEYNELRASGAPGMSWVVYLGIVFGILGIIILIVALAASGNGLIPVAIAGIALGIIFALIGMSLTQKNKKEYRNDLKAYELDFIDIKDERQQLENAISVAPRPENNDVEAEYQTFEKQLDELAQQYGATESINSKVWLEDNYVTQIDQLNKEISQMELLLDNDSFTDSAKDQWEDYKATLSDNHLSEAAIYHQFENDYLAWREARANKTYQDFAAQESKEKIDRIDEQIKQLEERQRQILEDYDVQNADELEAKADKQQQMLEKQKRFTILANHLDLSLLSYIEADESVDEQLMEKRDEIKALNEEITMRTDRLSQSRSEMKRLANAGQLEELSAQDEALASEALNAAVEWAARKVAIQVFEEATMGETGDANSLVMGQAVRYIHDLTDGRFDKLQYTDSGMTIHTSDDKWLPVEQLSRGEKALMFIALRFAFLNAQLGQIQLPIFIDEAFAHLDDGHLENVYRFLADRGVDNQIILLTTDQPNMDVLAHVAKQEI